MPPRDFDGFSGSLRSLLELCAEHLPPASVLQEAQRKLLEEIDAASAPLLVRRYGKHHRGMLVAAPGSPSFYPVDNEPLVGFYDHLARRGAPTATVFELIEDRQIPISWSLAPAAPAVPYKVGPASARFREAGLKLAHLVDCGRRVPEGPNEVRVRSFRTMSPVNVFPFPSPRRWDVVIAEPRVTFKDPTEDPTLLGFMAAFLAHHLRAHPDALETWRARCCAEGSSVRVDLAEADSIQVVIRRKAKASAPREGARLPHRRSTGSRSDIPGEAACRKVGAREPLDGVEQLASELRAWRAEHPSAERLDGRPRGSKGGTDWIHFHLELRADAFAVETADGEQLDGTAFSGRFALRGDVTSGAVDELLRLYDSDQPTELVFRADLTGGGTRCLRLASAPGVDGFYCYGR